MILPTRRLAVAVALGAPLWLVSPAAAVGAMALVGLAMLADLLRLPTARQIEVVRDAPATVGLGDDVVAEFHVRSRARFPAIVRLEHAMPLEIEDDAGPSMTLGTLGGGESRTVRRHLQAMSRGPWQLGDVALHVHTPLGLLRLQRRLALDQPMLVIPSLAGVRRFRLLAAHHRLHAVGVRSLRTKGAGRVLAGLREYTPGDDPRHVDWKSTARHGHLVTREFAVERSQPVILMVDCGRSMTQLAGTLPRFEHVLSAAMLLADVAATGGDQVGLLAFDDRVRAQVPAQRGALDAIRRAMTGLTATMVEPDHGLAFRTLGLRQRRRALVVFFTDVLDATSSRSLVQYAARAARRHALVIVAIRNESLLAAAHPATNGALALYASAAAEELVREREAALEQLRRAGAGVLDVGTGGMAVAAVNRYLEIKARGAV